MKKFEYYSIHKDELTEASIREIGKAGWEMVLITSSGYIYFKREVTT